MIARNEWIALGAAGLAAVAMPVFLLMPGAAKPLPARAPAPPPLSAPEQPPLAAAFDRTLFGPPAPEASETPADAPELVGVVGRLDTDAVAIVRTADGTSRTLHIGESVDGWKLESLAIDAAFFTRGTERQRVPLPAG
ncbi:hypothetical protein OF829_09330 [Sphingomonas sp. LB-2]|uniref:hypothetical protein n=1 Tax=Sphingomonas caeni TaxID=2984949 RepID=UPI0022301919|nr:hypothetical protein [Sphingomonas caeni]MCW3847444.1 hypothetical protein [Sphingomonas caeni]